MRACHPATGGHPSMWGLAVELSREDQLEAGLSGGHVVVVWLFFVFLDSVDTHAGPRALDERPQVPNLLPQSC